MIDERLRRLVTQIIPAMTELRQTLHAFPEPGFGEWKTAETILSHIEKVPNLAIEKGVGGTGIVVLLGRDKKGPCVGLRADMDALPVVEETGLPYRSRNEGWMHACGHDGHMACLVGAIRVLSTLEDDLRGPVKFIFQPAEEFDAGAERMCESGVLENPPVRAIFGLHTYSGRGTDLGGVAVPHGPAMAGSGNFSITIHGKGGHAAYPHACIDPIHIGMQTGIALQSIVSRSINPMDTAVVTVAKFTAGKATNIIPDSATLEGTFRSLSPSVLEKTGEKIRRIAEKTAESFGARATVTIEKGYPVLVNHAKAAALFRSVAEDVVGKERVRWGFPTLMGCEDFAFYTERIPGAFWFLGIRPETEKRWPATHSARFDFNDDALACGIELHCMTALRFADLWEE